MVFALELLVTVLKCLWLILVSIYYKFAPRQEKSLRGEIALVTGGASGIGRLLSIKFGKEGSTVVIWDINDDGMKKVADEVRAEGVKCFTYSCDISNREKVYEVAAQVKKDVGDVTILVNNAGIVTGKKFMECPDKLIEKTFLVNTIAHFWIVKAFLPKMLDNNHGHIVTISSNAGLVGVSGLADYCASKFAVYGFNESLRFELHKLGKTGVHTTVVCPYYINTGMFDGVVSKVPHLLPILDPERVVNKIMYAIKTNQEQLIMPWFSGVSPLIRSLFPIDAFDELVRCFGVSETMDTFKGRQKTD